MPAMGRAAAVHSGGLGLLVAGEAARYTVRRSCTNRGRNSVGRMPASQAGRRRFESGRPLLVYPHDVVRLGQSAVISSITALCIGARFGAHELRDALLLHRSNGWVGRWAPPTLRTG